MTVLAQSLVTKVRLQEGGLEKSRTVCEGILPKKI
jgi:hypothetical protein